MTVKSALNFIVEVRTNAGLKEAVAALGPTFELEPLLQLGHQAGFTFTEADLRQAFKHDWTMRWLRRRGARLQETEG